MVKSNMPKKTEADGFWEDATPAKISVLNDILTVELMSNSHLFERKNGETILNNYWMRLSMIS